MRGQIDPGMLRHRVTFQQSVRTPDGQGGATQAWQTHSEVWAYVEALSGRESVDADRLQARLSKRMLIRRNPSIHVWMRCHIDGVLHHIDWVAPYRLDDAYTELRIHEGGQA